MDARVMEVELQSYALHNDDDTETPLPHLHGGTAVLYSR